MIKKRILIFLIVLLGLIVRLYQLSDIPPSLSWDEASLGYNAYTIATSFYDEHGEFLPLARFIAFGDYKPPGYIYSAAPFVALFGLDEFSVRFPSVLGGVLSIIVAFFLAKELFQNTKIALISSLFVAVSPWAIHFSRAAFESNLAMFFNLLGVYFFIVSRHKGSVIVFSYIFFILSFYTFNANRIIAPLLLIALHFLYLKSSINNARWVILSILMSILLLLPSVGYLTNRESRLRFQEVSIFNNLIPIEISNKRIQLDGGSFLARLIDNRRIIFAQDYLKHYFDNFSGRFLFTHGDDNPRLSLQEMGVLYVFDFPLLLLGIYYLIAKRKRGLIVILLWMFIAPIPAATARETPHALRILSILPTFQLLSACGLYYLNLLISSVSFRSLRKTSIFLVLCFIFVISFFYYLHNYHIHYPVRWSGEWQYGYKQMVAYVSSVKNNYDQIFVTNELGRPYIYFAFYEKYPLSQFLVEEDARRDWFGFWTVDGLGKYRFNFDGIENTQGKILLVTTSSSIPENFKVINTIYNLLGDKVFTIASKT